MASGMVQKEAPLFMKSYTEDNISVAANNATSVNFNDIEISGYFAIAMVGANISNATSSGTNSSTCAIKAFFVADSGQQATVAVKNAGSAAAKVKVNVKILYQKI